MTYAQLDSLIAVAGRRSSSTTTAAPRAQPKASAVVFAESQMLSRLGGGGRG